MLCSPPCFRYLFACYTDGIRTSEQDDDEQDDDDDGGQVEEDLPEHELAPPRVSQVVFRPGVPGSKPGNADCRINLAYLLACPNLNFVT